MRWALRWSLGWGFAVVLMGCGDRWNRSFDEEAEGPHGLSLWPALLRTQWPAANLETLSGKGLDALPQTGTDGALYFAIGEGLPYDSAQLGRLLTFVEQGGTAFLASEELSIGLAKALVKGECLDERYELYFAEEISRGDTAVDSRGRRVLLDPVTRREGSLETAAHLALPHFCVDQTNVLIEVLHVPQESQWYEEPAADPSVTDGETYDPETYPADGDAEDYTDEGDDPVEGPDLEDTESEDVRYEDVDTEDTYGGSVASTHLLTELPYGSGHVLLYSAPIMLTNAYIADSIGRPHLSQVLSFLPRDASAIYFDAERRASAAEVYQASQPPEDHSGGPPPDRESLLREVFVRPALAAAWYMTLAAVVVFVLFGAKRRQRVVPVINARRNTTLAYLGSVSRLYLARPDNSLMARKQLALFEAYTVRKFGLRPVHNPDDRRRLAELQGVDDDKVEALLRYQATIDRKQGLSNDAFVRLVHLLRTLYQQLGRHSLDSANASE